jgi:hypothetical protein
MIAARVDVTTRARIDHFAALWKSSASTALERLVSAGFEARRAELKAGEDVTLARGDSVEIRAAFGLEEADLLDFAAVRGLLDEQAIRRDERAKVQREHGSRIFQEATK